MIDPITIGSTGLRAQQQVINTISNNVANLNSVAYKRQSAKMSTLLASSPSEANKTDKFIPMTNSQGLGVTVAGIERNMSQGQMQQTGSPLDFAIQGTGFFTLQREDGEQVFARSGSFTISTDGYLVDQSGNRLQPEIQIDSSHSNIKITSSGLLTSIAPNGATEQLGQIEIAFFQNPTHLDLSPSGNYLETERSGKAEIVQPGQEHTGQIIQGYLESSNVNLVDEFTSLVMAQRAYEASAKVVQTGGELFDAVNALLRA